MALRMWSVQGPPVMAAESSSHMAALSSLLGRRVRRPVISTHIFASVGARSAPWATRSARRSVAEFSSSARSRAAVIVARAPRTARARWRARRVHPLIRGECGQAHRATASRVRPAMRYRRSRRNRSCRHRRRRRCSRHRRRGSRRRGRRRLRSRRHHSRRYGVIAAVINVGRRSSSLSASSCDAAEGVESRANGSDADRARVVSSDPHSDTVAP